MDLSVFASKFFLMGIALFISTAFSAVILATFYAPLWVVPLVMGNWEWQMLPFLIFFEFIWTALIWTVICVLENKSDFGQAKCLCQMQ